MDKNELILKIVELRIKLQSLCDGFNTKNANKVRMLSMDKKVLFVLSNTPDCTPATLIKTLGIAKGNLALLCKNLIKLGLISKSSGEVDKRNIYYNITKSGTEVLNKFLLSFKSEAFCDMDKNKQDKLEKNLSEIIEFLNNLE